MSQLIDNHGRPITYLRLAVTDRCNLRCFYCMPADGIPHLPQNELLSYEEMHRLTSVLAEVGIKKVRITGGEPFVRKDLVPFLESLTQIKGIEQVSMTTNGVLTAPHILDLKRLKIGPINLSLDTLDKTRFFKISRRDLLEPVLDTFHQLLEVGISTKINMVVMDGINSEDIVPMAELTRKHAVEVRFLEEMPFNGAGNRHQELIWNHKKIMEVLHSAYSDLAPLDAEWGATATLYKPKGHLGTLGVIPSFSRTFCGSCNRIRITPLGGLKTCLYDNGVLDLRTLMRNGASDSELKTAFRHAVGNRAKDGIEAENNREKGPVMESMTTIGG